ncbi:MAG: PQQ-dependent sugar dehydrogenase [Phycisphaeraceae bacterium]
MENDQLLSTPFLQLNVTSAGERGLLGIAFDPDFANNHYVYLYYTVPPDAAGHNRISRFTADGNVAMAGSEVVMVDLPQVGYIHNGGAMHFGADGMLYVGVGDGSVPNNSQSLSSPFGKILRFDVRGYNPADSTTNPVGMIPTDNPFYNQATGINRAIWARGLRNPFTLAIDPATGRLYANDVGQDSWEEINEIVKGANYGWPGAEGVSGNVNFTNPIYAYNHFTGVAIIGGAFYQPEETQFPSGYVGGYFFADLGAGWLRWLNPVDNSISDFAVGLKMPVSILMDSDGSLLYLQRGASGHDGEVYRIEYPASVNAPHITTGPADYLAPQGGSATFSVVASGETPLNYQWYRDDQPISGANAASYTLDNITLSDAGAQFRVQVSNIYGQVMSDPATLSVTGNHAPVATILTPNHGSLYQGGQTVSFSGDAFDDEDGVLPDSAFTWQVDWYTGSIVRPELLATTGIRSGSFTIPDTVPYLLTNVFYRITLTVIDSNGLTDTVTSDLLPMTATIALASNVNGVSLLLDGTSVVTPHSVLGVTGIKRNLEAPATVGINGVQYVFTGWSDGGARSHDITTPASDTTYTASYVQSVVQPVLVVDDRGGGFSSVGTWGFTHEPGAYWENDHSFAINGGGANVATYTFTGLTPGVYRVSATWRGDSNRATNTPVSVYDGAALLGTVRINQELAPNSLLHAGFAFGDIGDTWNITGATLVVTISDDADQYVDADAIRIERIGDLPAPGPEIAIALDGADLVSGQSVVDFGSTAPGSPQRRTLTLRNTGQTMLNLGAIDPLPAGFVIESGFGATQLAPGESTSMIIRLTAVNLGAFGGTLALHNNDANEDPFTIALRGEVTTEPNPLLPGFTQTLLASGLSGPTAMTQAPDGRIFIANQDGTVNVVKDGQLMAQPFLVINTTTFGERGLLGIALDPNFSSNHYVYVYYTVPGSGQEHNRISRFVANGDVVLPGSETVLVDFPQMGSVHNGGALGFGPDGKLYVGIGDNSTPSNAQSLANIFGKILRFNADGSIPTDNPFYNQLQGLNRSIYALGFRNPFTFTFQPGTGRFFVNDVGQSSWEEIDDVVAGNNYGWPTIEGPGGSPTFTPPFYAYTHADGAIAITGGAFYSPTQTQFPEFFVGGYFFADLGAGWIHWLDLADQSVSSFAVDASFPVSLLVEDSGTLLYLERGHGGQLHRIQYAPAAVAPVIDSQPVDQTVGLDGSATFSVAVTGTAPLTYQWRRNGDDIDGANGPSYTLGSVTLADSGAIFTVFVSNSEGFVLSDEAVLTVIDEHAPTTTILTPAIDTLYQGGQTISFSGEGFDQEDGALSAAAFTWKVEWYTGSVVRPHLGPVSGVTSGSFDIPDRVPYTATDVFYRITLTVADSAGLVTSVYRDVAPQTASITLTSNLPNVTLTLDGQGHATPYSVHGVTGIIRSLGAPATVQHNGLAYSFVGWSDSGALVHDISTPAVDTIYTAIYAPPSVLIVDDRSAAFSTGGTWGFTTEAIYYGSDHSFAINGGGANVATYTFTGLAPGVYRVSATWRGDTNRATNTPFGVHDGATLLGTVRINQRNAPNSLTDQGFAFGDIGTSWSILGDTLVVRISDDVAAGVYVDADAIRIERIGDLPSGPEIALLDGTASIAHNTGVVDLGVTAPGVPVTRTITVQNTGVAPLTLGAFAPLPAGFSMASGFATTTLAPGASTTFAIRFDAPATGSFSGTVSFANNDADEGPFAFTVQGSAAAAPMVRIIDDRDAGFSTVGAWGSTTESFYYGNDHSFAINGGGANVATYTFTGLAPGVYRVSATWRGDSNRATNTPFRVYDGTTLLGTVRVNQQNAPAGLTEQGKVFGDIGTSWNITGGTLVVKLSDDAAAGLYVDADAIRIERLGDLPAGPEIQVLVDTTDLVSGSTTVDFGVTPPGTPVQRTFTVRNLGTQTLTLGAFDPLPAGYSVAAGFATSSLAPNQSTTFTLQFDAASAGTFDGMVRFANNDGNEGSFAINVHAVAIVQPVVRIIDDRDAGFSTNNVWGFTLEPYYYGGDHSFARDGQGANVATYTFTNLPPGEYRISATWRSDLNRATNTPYAIYDGSTLLDTVRVNQELAPDDRTDQETIFKDLGTSWTISSGTLIIRISDDANDFVDADAIRIERIG